MNKQRKLQREAEAGNQVPGWAQIVIDAHLAAASAAGSYVNRQGDTVAAAVSHAARMESRRYFVWQEDGGNDLAADNKHDELAVTGYTDLFTELEFDQAAPALGTAFDEAGMAWEYTGASYEPDTGLFHHTWEWEVV